MKLELVGACMTGNGNTRCTEAFGGGDSHKWTYVQKGRNRQWQRGGMKWKRRKQTKSSTTSKHFHNYLDTKIVSFIK